MLSLPWLLLVTSIAGIGQPVSLTPPAEHLEPVQSSRSLDWEALVERNLHVSFTQRADGDALVELARDDLEESERAVALFALGTARRDDSDSLLVRSYRKGSYTVQRAAILALGEARLVDEELLETWLSSADPMIRECGLLAGLLGGEPSARGRLNQIIAEDLSALGLAAQKIADFVNGSEDSQETASTRLYLELRYEAAKQFGLIDGQSWGVLVMESVVQDDAFLDGVILPASARVIANGVEDHLLHALLDGSGRPRIEAALIAMPEVVGELMEYSLWNPKDAEEWYALLDTIWENRLEDRAGSVLVRALDYPKLQRRAASSIARLEDKEPALVLLPSVMDLEDSSPEERTWAIEFLVQLDAEDSVDRLEAFFEDESPLVRAKARVAMLRLDGPNAERDLLQVCDDLTNEARPAALDELCANAQSALVSRFLTDLLVTEKLDLERRIRVGCALILEGRGTNHEQFSEDIRAVPIEGELGALIIRALAERGLADDLAYLEAHFPTEGDMVVNLAAAKALVGRNSPYGLPILQAAMWRGPWDRSILACVLLIETSGFRALKDELDQPPPEATSKDLRRVGFALGEWGGIERVELFARQLRTGTGDPILQGAILGALAARTH